MWQPQQQPSAKKLFSKRAYRKYERKRDDCHKNMMTCEMLLALRFFEKWQTKKRKFIQLARFSNE